MESRSDKGQDTWYPLDNAAILMASISGRRKPQVFRVSARIDEPVSLSVLQTALENIAPRFPTMLAEMRRGLFWYYLEPLAARPKVIADSRFPCERMRVRRTGRFLFRVRAYRDRVACEFSHIITDGAGALVFLKSLLGEYFRLEGESWKGEEIPRSGSHPLPGEDEDSYAKIFEPADPPPRQALPAFRLRSTCLPEGQFRIISGRMSLSEALAHSRGMKASLTEFLVAVYLACLQDIHETLPPRSRAKARSIISVHVPVNLRKHFPSSTLRNFVAIVAVSIDLALGHYELPEIVGIVHHTLRMELSEKNLRSQVSRNVRSERNFLVRISPLAAKNLLLRAASLAVADSPCSGTFSNLGPVTMPKELEKRVLSFDFIQARSHAVSTQGSACSYGDELSVSFGSTLASNELERRFFTRLAGSGMRIKLESNL